MLLSNFSATDDNISALLTLVTSSLSVIGATFLILSYVRIPEIRNNARAMLVYLTIADLLTVFGCMFASIKYFVLQPNFSFVNISENDFTSRNETKFLHYMCHIQSFVTTSSSMASFIWTMFIAGYLFRCVCFEKGHELTRWKNGLLHLMAWGVPVVIATLALLKGVLGRNAELSGIWCWLSTVDRKSTLIWGLVTGKGWEILTYITIVLLYFLMKLKTHSERKRRRRSEKATIGWDNKATIGWDNINPELRREDELFCFTWIILYSLRMWGTIRFILEIIADFDRKDRDKLNCQKIERYLLYLQSVGDCAQAFCNFLLFCVLDKTVRSHFICNHAREDVLSDICQERSTRRGDYPSTSIHVSLKLPCAETAKLLSKTEKKFYTIEKAQKENIKTIQSSI